MHFLKSCPLQKVLVNTVNIKTRFLNVCFLKFEGGEKLHTTRKYAHLLTAFDKDKSTVEIFNHWRYVFYLPDNEQVEVS